jgi:hypothetical protein
MALDPKAADLAEDTEEREEDDKVGEDADDGAECVGVGAGDVGTGGINGRQGVERDGGDDAENEGEFVTIAGHDVPTAALSAAGLLSRVFMCHIYKILWVWVEKKQLNSRKWET